MNGGGGVVEAAERPRGDIEGKHPRGQPTGQPTGRPRGRLRSGSRSDSGSDSWSDHGSRQGTVPCTTQITCVSMALFGQRRDILRIRGNPGMGGRGRPRERLRGPPGVRSMQHPCPRSEDHDDPTRNGTTCSRPDNGCTRSNARHGYDVLVSWEETVLAGKNEG